MADIPELLDLEKACFTEYYRQHRFGAYEFADYIQDEAKIVRLARVGADLAGYVAGTVDRSGPELIARLDSLAVMEEFREKGVGDHLLTVFVREVKRRGCLRILITVAAANESGIMFFSNRDFQTMRRLPDYYDEGVDGILMRRDT
jgi:ribosomal-protein-alanine N-acetyltransferase